MFAAVPLLFCFALAFKRAITLGALLAGGVGLFLRLIRPLSARRA